jgi:zinc transporter 2
LVCEEFNNDLCKCAGGYLANSLAIMTDAGHLLSDLLSFLISLAALHLAQRPATARLSFGYHRAGLHFLLFFCTFIAEVLGAVVSIFIIWILTAFLVYEAILRCLPSTKFESKLKMQNN